MKKSILAKILSVGLIIAITATASIAGTLAYLTDRDSKVNVFTLGDVSIALNEQFEQDSNLVPGLKVEKEATITNTGKNDAYVWMTIAVPYALDKSDASKNILHWNIPGAFWNGYHTDQKYIESAIKNGYLPAGSSAVEESKTWIVSDKTTEVTIDDIKYTVYTLLYKGAIKSSETTNIGISEVYMDTHVDIHTDGELYWVEKGVAEKLNWNINKEGEPVVYVSAYAIQAEGFDNVEAAYNAYNEQWGDNGTEYAEISTVSE